MFSNYSKVELEETMMIKVMQHRSFSFGEGGGG
jgi:hypothetical protein